jgi:hypothetical protein
MKKSLRLFTEYLNITPFDEVMKDINEFIEVEPHNKFEKFEYIINVEDCIIG